MKMTRIITFVTFAISTLCTVQAACPPAGFDSKQNGFNPIKFFDGRWFSLKQLPVSYQPEDEFYCVSTNYEIEKKIICKLFGCDETVIRVSTASKKGSINGPVKSKSLNGIIKNSVLPTRVSIGAPFIPSAYYSPYWVIEAGSYSDLLYGNSTTFEGDQYDWAIISSGAPETPANNGCLPAIKYLSPRGLHRLNPSGVWIYSRQPIVSKEIIFLIEVLAASKGFDVSILKTVVQEGCT
jgi:lipocalin